MFTRDSKILSHRLTTPLTSVANAVGDVFKPTYNQIIKPLFANGEQGFAYDPNDLSTMFQDAAGTIPVTGVGQPVGLMLDKRKELVLGSELVVNGDFSDGLTGWAPVITPPATVNVVNSKAELSAVGTGAVARLRKLITVTAGTWYKVRVDVTGNTIPTTVLQLGSIAGGVDYGNFALVSGKNTFHIYVAGTNLHFQFYKGANNGTAYIDNVSVKSISGNHAYQTNAASRPLLQRNATTGVYYLAFDGSDDFLVTSSINFTATDKLSLFAGVRKLSDAATGIVCELSSSLIANNGTFYLLAPTSYGIDSVGFTSKGTLASGANTTGYVSPASLVITGQSSISTPLSRLRINGVIKLTSTPSQGTGNYGNYPLYIGRRGGTSIPFNGHLYSLIGVARLSTDTETTAVEKAIAKNVGVTLNV